MNNKVIVTETFERRVRRFLKKFRSLSEELEKLEQELLENPKKGVCLGSDIYKIRLASKSKGRGKSGDFRVITYLLEIDNDSFKIYLLTMYDKSEEVTITKSKLFELVRKILLL